MPPAAFPAFAGPPLPKGLRRLKAASRLRAEALRRASAQAGGHLAVLTYSSAISARPTGCGLPFDMTQGRTGRAFLRQSSGHALNTPLFFSGGLRLFIC